MKVYQFPRSNRGHVRSQGHIWQLSGERSSKRSHKISHRSSSSTLTNLHTIIKTNILNNCSTLDKFNKITTNLYANPKYHLHNILPHLPHYTFFYWSWILPPVLTEIQMCIFRLMQVRWTKYSVTHIFSLHSGKPILLKYIQNPSKNWLINTSFAHFLEGN